MHHAALAFIAEHLPANADVLEFGSRNINGSPRQVAGAGRYVGVDIAPGPGVDIVESAATVTVDGSFGVVVCAEVFEHADDDTCAAIVANAWRHLADGGLFIATMAGPGRREHSAVDGGPLRGGEFYRNVDRPLLSSWLKAAGFAEFATDALGDDMRCVAWKH